MHACLCVCVCLSVWVCVRVLCRGRRTSQMQGLCLSGSPEGCVKRPPLSPEDTGEPPGRSEFKKCYWHSPGSRV